MATAKSKDAIPEDRPTSSRYARTHGFNEQQYVAFDTELERRGSTPGKMFNKLIVDYNQGRYINTDNLPEDTLAALRKLAENQRIHFAAAVDSALNEWASTRAKKK